MEKRIVLIVNDEELIFNVTAGVFEKFQDEIQQNKKVAPMKNFLMRCVDDSSKDLLKELLKTPTMAAELTHHIGEEFVPDIKITVGK